MKIDQQQPRRGTIEAKDMFAPAPPGHSLTQDNQQWPWGQAPKHVDPEVVLDRAIDQLSQPKIKGELMKLLIVGASVESLVEGFVFQSFSEGKFSPDVGQLIKGPLSIVLAGMAEEEGIPYRLFENDNALEADEMDDETFFRMMKQNNPSMFAYVNEQINEAIRRGHTPQEPEPESFMTMKREAE
jgi:hypothetical protein